jgi:hypothetical protein
MKDTAMYCFSFLLISVPVYWLLPWARLRYILPLAGPLALLITIPLHAVVSGKIQDSVMGKRFIQTLGMCIILAVVTSPFWAKRFELFKQPVPIILLGLLFLTSLLLVWWKKELQAKMVLLMFTVLLIKILWASFYFPYHAAHHSHYRGLAGQINLLVPYNATLYSHDLDNPHITYYLKRPVICLESIDKVSEKNGAFLLIDDQIANTHNLSRLSLIAKIKERNYFFMLYRAN